MVAQNVKYNSLAELEVKADEIVKMAEDAGLQQNFFFISTFERYRVQLRLLEQLKQVFEKDGMLTTKEYIKDKPVLVPHPAVLEYNRTTDSANKTVASLLRILRDLNMATRKAEKDPLMEFILTGKEK